ncbi:MAG: TonB-dependent receptor [Bacteroidaceae bacterium]|nr:TonB-dependent receptor [Bacteroidaceae bacterium]
MVGLLLGAGLTLSQPIQAQTPSSSQTQSTITGTVVDNLGEPLPGASVVVTGANSGVGTVTDFDGNFSLKVPAGTTLRISCMGFQAQVVKATRGMKVTLEENATVMESVEVVAYGVQKKVTVTGAVSSVKSEDLVRTPIASVENVLGGQLTGVTTVQYSGEPGSDAAKIFVRGKATFNDANPLIQVDGVERSMSDIDPNEIESVTILKDASATAVFGIRGANGVILITTKRGKEGKARISASTTFSALTPTKMVEQATSAGYAQFYNQMVWNDNPSAAQYFPQAVIDKFTSGSDPIRFPNTQWADYIMKDVTLQTQHNLSISGGTDRVRYFISAGMYTQDGMFKQFNSNYDYGYQYDRFNYRSNIDLDITKTTTISLNIAGNVNNADKPYTGQGASGLIKTMYYATPFSSPGIVDGKMVTAGTDYTDGVNMPFIGGNGMGYYGKGFMQTNNNKLQMDLQLNQKLDMITKGLSFKAKGAYNSVYVISKQGQASVATYTPVLMKLDATTGSYTQVMNSNPVVDGDVTTLYYKKDNENTVPSYSSSTSRGRDWYVEASLNYNRSFGLHSITGLALYNQSRQYYYGSSYNDIPRTYLGFVGRVTYDYNNRYMAEVDFGYNGSENFAPGKRFGAFPAGSIGWVMSDEEFFKPLKGVINFLKPRASWGLVGNDKLYDPSGNVLRFYYTPDPYDVNLGSQTNRGASSTYDPNAWGYQFGIENGTTTMGARETELHNSDVGWEKAFKQNYGLDMNLFDDKLRLTFDYYLENRTDILLTSGLAPGFLGFSVPQANLGKVKSHGWEVSANWNHKIGKFRYWAKVNLSYNQNEIVEMMEAPFNNEYQYLRGHRIGARSMYKFWKYYYDGCEADYQKEFGTPFPTTTLVAQLQPGDPVFVDLDQNGIIDANDRSLDYGYTDDPEYMAGLILGGEVKGFSFNLQFTGAWNVTRMLSEVFMQPFYSAASTTSGGLLQYHIDNTWTPTKPSQSAEYPRATWTNAGQNYAPSTLFEKDAKYLRLKTIQVAYDFDIPLMKKLGMSQLQVSLSAYNLFTLSPYIWGDPEARASNAPSYPLQRTVTAGLKVAF